MNCTVTQFSGGITGVTGDTSLRKVANYLIWLCGKFGMQVLANHGGGSVTPIPPSGAIPQKIEFYVNDTDSPIITDESSLYLPLFKGYQLLVFKNGVEQTLLTDGTDSSYTWNTITGLFTCTPSASFGDKFSIAPY